jgi:hypothetical protein
MLLDVLPVPMVTVSYMLHSVWCFLKLYCSHYRVIVKFGVFQSDHECFKLKSDPFCRVIGKLAYYLFIK